ncbi:hypothetical protein MAA8898_02674 [Maliponia aquimaris]|uniref:Uncharacterized protein n=1 Tax=Maliponia aquimaris TaxID=1673631 RepID=A0A238KIU2_9RHOB|nr:hypothetical protein [Maliponia aquimaris]SMX42640.1 hypothetical protein MAA8898_02674 [Maliponia aquimaris]
MRTPLLMIARVILVEHWAETWGITSDSPGAQQECVRTKDDTSELRIYAPKMVRLFGPTV